MENMNYEGVIELIEQHEKIFEENPIFFAQLKILKAQSKMDVFFLKNPKFFTQAKLHRITAETFKRKLELDLLKAKREIEKNKVKLNLVKTEHFMVQWIEN